MQLNFDVFRCFSINFIQRHLFSFLSLFGVIQHTNNHNDINLLEYHRKFQLIHFTPTKQI